VCITQQWHAAPIYKSARERERERERKGVSVYPSTMARSACMHSCETEKKRERERERKNV